MNASHLPPHSATLAQPPLVPHSPDDPYVNRTERGLVVRGTRITLYALWEDVQAGDDSETIRQFYSLKSEQVAGVLTFIRSNQAAFDVEYQFVLQAAEDVRRYHEERNRERFAEIAALPPPPGKEQQYAELQERKRRLGMK
jgi:uncharacterized protein (DUF433 family)